MRSLRISPALIGIAALLRTGAVIYGGLWVVAALTARWGEHGDLAAACLLPLSPLVMVPVTAALLKGQHRDLRIVPFAVACVATGAALTAGHVLLGSGGPAYAVLGLGAVIAAALATRAYSEPWVEVVHRPSDAKRAANAYLSSEWANSRMTARP